MKNKLFKSTHLLALGLALSISSAHAAITAVNSNFFGGSAPGATVTQSVTVGATADMLILMTSMELGNSGGTSNLIVTYGGVAMIRATGNTIQSNIHYLDLSTPGISGTDIVVDMTDLEIRNGFAAGWVSIDGNLGVGETIALHSTGTAGGASHTVSLTTSVQTFNVVNFNGNINTGTVTVNSPNPSVIYTDNNIGSANAAAAYAAGVAAGTSIYEWTLGTPGAADVNYRRIDAAAFAVVPEPSSSLLIGGFGVLALLRRRRK